MRTEANKYQRFKITGKEIIGTVIWLIMKIIIIHLKRTLKCTMTMHITTNTFHSVTEWIMILFSL